MASGTLRKAAGIAGNSLLWSAAVGVLILNILLFQQNRSLRSRMESLSGTYVVAGQQVRDLSGVSLDGYFRPITLPESDSERLLIIGFSPNCQYCRANQDRWQVLARGMNEHKGWHVVWVSRDPIVPTTDYCKAQGIPYKDVVAEPPMKTYDQLGLRVVPRTIVIGSGGVVEKVWSGQLDANQWKEVFSFLNLSWNATLRSLTGPQEAASVR